MAEHFSIPQWQQIEAHLDAALAADGQAYGLPERRDGSLILMAWNIRKFGALTDSEGPKKSAGATRMIQRIAERADLLAIQEQQDDTGALLDLQSRLNAAGGNFGILISDVTGRAPGYRGMAERFAWLFNRDRVRLGDLASDLSMDRTAVSANMREAMKASLGANVPGEDDPGFLERLRRWAEDQTRMTASRMTRFVQFIRSPHLVEFIVETSNGRYVFNAVNAHLISGKKREREQEFFALLEWLLLDSRKTVSRDGKITLIMGDLNLDFERSVDRRRAGIENYVTGINQARRMSAKVNFPFLDGDVRTNARKTQTFDHIAWIADDVRMPRGHNNHLAGTQGLDGYDYGMFDFTQLFLEAGPGALPDGTIDFDRFAHDLSDHMPIWVRLALP